MAKRSQSQLMELFLAIADALGHGSDRDVAALADVGPENVANWRSGAVKEFKNQKFRAVLSNLAYELRALKASAGSATDDITGLTQVEVEAGSSPSELEKQFRDRVAYDYLGHRFLYFEPQGALAWENLIKAGYEQDCWLSGVDACAEKWLDLSRDSSGRAKGPIAKAVGLSKRDRARGLDVITLGPGEGGKEAKFLEQLFRATSAAKERLSWLTYAPIEVSTALLLAAAQSSRRLLFSQRGRESASASAVLPFLADFEEGRLTFLERLRTSQESGEDGLRLVLILGNVLGNLRDEETFIRQKLRKIARPGDLVWFEFGLRSERVEDDPLYKMTAESTRKETAAEANRRLLLEGPYRRFASAIGRHSPKLALRIWVREDDESARVPGSYNFCHDLVIENEGRVVTMLYSRRYNLEDLTHWFEGLSFSVEAIHRVADSKGRERVAHLLLRRM